ncbi:GNAT family N-acetyltransferase [Agromyces italicus]|uniref:GNAT family N-acetyltransferase n=1 Tax=Agromyces italicus TaxID=279572 RepID=UPI003D15FA6D
MDCDRRAVGMIWLGPHPREVDGVWWAWGIEIDETARGRGFGRAAMRLAEDYVATRGGHELALDVFGFNTRSRALCQSLGYQITAVQWLDRDELRDERVDLTGDEHYSNSSYSSRTSVRRAGYTPHAAFVCAAWWRAVPTLMPTTSATTLAGIS